MAHVGSRALWQPATLRELYCAFAEPHAIGLSSIAGLLHPAARTDPDGVVVRLAGAGPAPQTVLAPIAPGRRGADRRPATPGRSPPAEPLPAWSSSAAPSPSTASGRSSSGRRTPVTVTLAPDGPRVLDVRAVLRRRGRARSALIDAGERRTDRQPVMQNRKILDLAEGAVMTGTLAHPTSQELTPDRLSRPTA